MECEVFLQLSVMARRTRSTRRRRSRRGGATAAEVLAYTRRNRPGLANNEPTETAVANLVESSPKFKVQSPEQRAVTLANELRVPRPSVVRHYVPPRSMPSVEEAEKEAPALVRQKGSRNLIVSPSPEPATDAVPPQKNSFEPTAVKAGRRTRRRRGGAMSDEEKRAVVDDILAAIANAPPDKLQLLKDAVGPIEPLALKVEVADAAKEATPEAALTAITELLMKLDDEKLTALKTAIVPKEGGDETEDEAFMARQAERQRARQARQSAVAEQAARANLPLRAKVKSAIVSSGQNLERFLSAVVFVLAGTASNGGRTRRRRRGSRRA